MISGNSSSGSTKNLNRAVRIDFANVRRGDIFSYTYDVSSIDVNGTETTADLTGYYAQMHLKKKKTDESYYVAMDVVIDSSAGTITFSKSANDMRIPARTYWYDLEIKDANSRNITWIEGKFKVIQDITEWILEKYQDMTTVLSHVSMIVRGIAGEFTRNYVKFQLDYKFIQNQLNLLRNEPITLKLMYEIIQAKSYIMHNKIKYALVFSIVSQLKMGNFSSGYDKPQKGINIDDHGKFFLKLLHDYMLTASTRLGYHIASTLYYQLYRFLYFYDTAEFKHEFVIY